MDEVYLGRGKQIASKQGEFSSINQLHRRLESPLIAACHEQNIWLGNRENGSSALPIPQPTAAPE